MEKQSNNKAIWIIITIVALLAVGATAYALSVSNDDNVEEQPSSQSSSNTKKDTASDTDDAGKADKEVGSTVIVFTDDGFNPQSYTSKVGEAVTVRNESKMDLEFSSADHPTHRENPELNMDLLSSGESGTFTPPGKGTYKFHDHINDQFTGSITVE